MTMVDVRSGRGERDLRGRITGCGWKATAQVTTRFGTAGKFRLAWRLRDNVNDAEDKYDDLVERASSTD